MPMTGAQRVKKHRQRQKERIAELEREVADLKNQQAVSNGAAAPTANDDGRKVYLKDVVALAIGLDLTYTELTERALAMAAELEEREGRTTLH